jgi:hypothetical protein
VLDAFVLAGNLIGESAMNVCRSFRTSVSHAAHKRWNSTTRLTTCSSSPPH